MVGHLGIPCTLDCLNKKKIKNLAFFFFHFKNKKIQKLNSSPIDELGNWCQESLVGGPVQSMRHSKEVSMATL